MLLERADMGISDAQYKAWQSAGFYAVAYDTPYGTVISYRPDCFRCPEISLNNHSRK